MYKLYNGDCLEILRTLPAGSVDAVVTDPPYFLPVNTYVGTREKGYHKRTLGDMSVMQTYFDTTLGLAIEKIKPTGNAYIFCDGQSYPLIYRTMYQYFAHVRPIIRDKITSFNGYTWRHQHELIAWGEGYEAERIPTGDGDVIKCRGVMQKDRLHPAEKPIEIMTRILEKCGQVILDPFLGSSPVGAAAVRLGKDYIGIEIDPTYYAIAERRIQEAQPCLIA